MKRPLPRTLAWLAAALVLGGTFVLYAQPQFMVQVADQVWSCFGGF